MAKPKKYIVEPATAEEMYKALKITKKQQREAKRFLEASVLVPYRKPKRKDVKKTLAKCDKVLGEMFPPHGYHKIKITKGELGEISKIQEELDELKDATEQNNRILALCELADLYGAIRAHLAKHYLSVSMEDLDCMATATKRAFDKGERK